MPLTLRTLGQLQLLNDGELLLPRRRKELTLLAYLARRPAQCTTRTALATLFWGDRDDRHARQSLRQALLVLRQGLGTALEAEGEEVRLEVGALEVDAIDFESDVQAGRLAEATARWRGQFLEGQEDAGTEEFRDWVQVEREGLRGQFAAASARLVQAARERGDWTGALSAAERWCRMTPDDEQAQRTRMEVSGLRGGLAGMGEYAPVGSAGLLTPDLVGREEVFTRLTGAWAEAQQGAGVVVLVEGSAGTGKSRLLAELRRFVVNASPRAVLSSGRGYETERGRRYSTVRQILTAFAHAPGILAVPPEMLAALSAASPEIRERFSGLAEPASGEGFADAFRRAVQEVAAESPCLILCDDAGLADPASQDALASLVRNPPAGAMLLVATHGETLAGTELGSDLRQRAETLRLRLGPLALADIQRLVGSVLPVSPDLLAPLARHLHAASGGNPGLTVSLVGLLADEGILHQDARGVWQLTSSVTADTVPLPVDLRAAVESRRERLPDDARRLLDAAAVLGSPFRAEDAEAIADLAPAGRVSGLGVLLSRAWVREARAGLLEFTGEGTRRAVYDLIGPAERHRLHRGAHGRLRELSSRDSADSARLALHRSRGGERPAARRSALIGGGLALLPAAALLAWWLRSSAPPDPQSGPIVLAVEPFVSPSTPSDQGLARGVGDLVTRSLNGAGLIQVADSDRAAVTAVVRGQATENGEQVVLTASLVIARDGAVIGRVGAVGPRARVDSLAELLAARLLATAALLDQDRPGGAREPGTESLAAVKAYLRGERLFRAGIMARALDQMNEAIRADSQFARAWHRRAQIADWLNQPGVALSSIRRARALADRVSESERRLYPAYEAYLLGHFEQSEKLLRDALGYMAADPDARVALGETLLHGNWTRGRAMKEAESEFAETLRLRPTDPTARRHAGDLAYRRGDSVRGDSLYEAVYAGSQQWPSRSLTHLAALQAFSTRDTAKQSRVLDTLDTSGERLVALAAWVVSLYHPVPADVARIAALLVAPGRPTAARALGHNTLAYLAVGENDLASAASHLRSATSLAPEETLLLEGYLRLSGRLGSAADAPASIRTGLANLPPPDSASVERVVPETVHPLIARGGREYLLALAAMALGDRGGAAGGATRLELMGSRMGGFEAGLAHSVRARLALGVGDTARAVRELQGSWDGIQFEQGRASPLISRPADRVLMGDLLARTGRREEARGWYQSISELSPWDLAWLPLAQQGLATLDGTTR